MKEELVEEIGKDIKQKNTMSKEYEGKVNKRIFSNILIAVSILVYLIIVVLGSKNIENNIFIVDLKVFSIILSLISIIIFERSYKKSDGKLVVYGIETLILAIVTLVSVYVFQITERLFTPIICAIAIVVSVYYVIKSIGIYAKSKKGYIKSQSDMKEIIKEELPETVETKRRRSTLETEMEKYHKLDEDAKTIKSFELDDKDDIYNEIFEEDDSKEDSNIESIKKIKKKDFTSNTKSRSSKENTKSTKNKTKVDKTTNSKEETKKETANKSTGNKKTAGKSETRKSTTSKKEKESAIKKENSEKEVKESKEIEKKVTKKTTSKAVAKKEEKDKTEKPAKKQTTAKKSTTKTKEATDAKKKTATKSK